MATGRMERDLVYLANIHGQQLRYKHDYSTIGSSWQIILNNVTCNSGNLRKTYYIISDDEDRKIYSEKFRINNIDLVVASKVGYNEKPIRWCRILKTSTKDEIVKERGDDLMDKEAREKLLEDAERNIRDKSYMIYTRCILEMRWKEELNL